MPIYDELLFFFLICHSGKNVEIITAKNNGGKVERVLSFIVLKMFTSLLSTYLINYLAGFQAISSSIFTSGVGWHSSRTHCRLPRRIPRSFSIPITPLGWPSANVTASCFSKTPSTSSCLIHLLDNVPTAEGSGFLPSTHFQAFHQLKLKQIGGKWQRIPSCISPPPPTPPPHQSTRASRNGDLKPRHPL